MNRSELTVDLRALRRNVRTLLRVIGRTELWAVVKADAYGHGAIDVARAALDEGAAALCVVTVPEALALRAVFPDARILCMGRIDAGDVADARAGALEVVQTGDEIFEGIRVHVKLDTGMGRFGISELVQPTRDVVGLMSHLATADMDPHFARTQIDRFEELTRDHAHLTRHIANSAAALRIPESRFDAARCGIALYGLSPFDGDPAADGLEPVLSWRSHLALVKQLRAGESTGYGRRFVAERPTWVGLVPVGYADGFRRGLTGTSVLVAGELRRVVGTISMDSFAVELDRELPVGAPVTLLGDGLRAEAHAEVLGTINYEIATGVNSDPRRATRVVLDD